MSGELMIGSLITIYSQMRCFIDGQWKMILFISYNQHACQLGPIPFYRNIYPRVELIQSDIKKLLWVSDLGVKNIIYKNQLEQSLKRTVWYSSKLEKTSFMTLFIPWFNWKGNDFSYFNSWKFTPLVYRFHSKFKKSSME